MHRRNSFCSVLPLLGVILALSTPAVPGAETPSREPNLRIGVVGDMQAMDLPEDRGLQNTRKAFELLAARNIDVLLNPGDIAQRAEQNVYTRYMKIYREVFGRKGKLPVHVPVPGNHDFWHNPELPPEECLKNFAIGMEEKDARLIHKSVKQYDFISIAAKKRSGSGIKNPESEKALRDAEAKTPANHPIFVVTHRAPSCTVLGSYSWGNYEVLKLLEQHPRVISLSGHSHCPVDDERSIWQGAFTAIGCGSINYCDMEDTKRINGPTPPRAKECVQALYLEVFDDHVDVFRYQVLTGEEIKPDRRWRIDLPYSPAKARYTKARAATCKAPEFPAGAKLETRLVRKGVRLAFPAATHDDSVHTYAAKIAVLNDAASAQAPAKELLFFSDSYLGPQRMAKTVELRLPAEHFAPGKRYRIEILPQEAFGKRAEKGLTAEITVPGNFRFRKK
ncbi:MAG: metallophosphoesterase [Victivallaceae bacterium]|nr:metallophosphoesterase [Victivallaceae bacterium]